MRNPFNFFPHNGLIFLLCAALIGSGTASAQGMHDHGDGKHQTQSSSPVRDVALPEGIGATQSIAIDSNGWVWFTEKAGNKLTAYDPEKQKFATHSLPPSWGDMGFSNITLGADGEIWFTVNRRAEGADNPHILGRFTPADGYFTKYALPHKSAPEELIVDANGTIWFFASNKNNLYRIDPKTFALKGYPIPTANGHPRGLAVDQKGHVWFAESNANKIGRFIPEQEVFHEYEVLTPFANPGKISIDHHGNVWFVEVTANRIGVFHPDRNRFSEAIIPTPGSAPVALVNDGDGNVWFLQYKGNKVGVFNLETAAFREYDIPAYNSLPAGIAIDRKRSTLWFTQSATEAKSLGMLSISEALAHGNKQGAVLEKSAAAGGGMPNWFVLLAVLLAVAALGGWLAWKSRKGVRP
ncbi:MAG: hypothetical protein A3F73_08010 [Gallionellales bacterium RIFCSPLOWO2_12_FULL_59_22]|nr:MAG: hypothetical protein A3H99_10590 [Gallionellales bacterium RIFCSPLOWO2_02_FULL_59_110]OGT04283.1 MAG: hypothetical protein A2Z65_06100 [Gallionellales bacterium RIFCSPLOWO2_02_58_13]OGT13273.1 MAG: hypothetical protein A3F73_08010 [Gallionellales bacterium RIFCSPLOWO2_12_FULL_59_22]